MEEKFDANTSQIQPGEGYTPRPAWQVWLARAGLVLFVGLVILSYLAIANGVFL